MFALQSLKKKKTLAIATALFVVAGTGSAVAYWTTSGAGSGTATNGSSNGSLVLKVSFADGLVPGGSEPVTITASNAGTSNLRFSTLSGSPAITTSSPSCLPADFTLSGLTTTPATINAGATDVQVGSATLNFANTAADQDGCKGATVTISVASA